MAYLVYAQVAELVSVEVNLRCESNPSGLPLPELSVRTPGSSRELGP
jgi:hypothetical protein